MGKSKRPVLLVHPLGYRAGGVAGDIARIANIMPPLGLAGVAAYLLKKKIPCHIIDCNAHPDAENRLYRLVRDEKPAFIGFSCATANFLDGVRHAIVAKRLHPGLRVVFGGPHVSALKHRILTDFPVIDFAVVGEGERTFESLVSADGCRPWEIPGLVYRDLSGEVLFSGYPQTISNLDTLPFPAYHKLDGFPRSYRLPIFNYPKSPATSCVSSRGCPYACSYCDRSVFGRSFRYNSAEYLHAHLAYLKRSFGIRHVNFYDDQFTFRRQRVIEFTRLMQQRPLGITFNCAVRAEHIDTGLVREMKRAGCWMISLGIESGDPDLLSRHRRNVDLQMLADKITLIKKGGIRVKGLLMMGLPGESEASVAKSMGYVSGLPIDDFNLTKFTPFPGSPLYENIGTYGRFDENWPQMDCMHFLFVPKGMTFERLEELHQKFYKRHFLRVRTLWDLLSMAWRSPESWWRFIADAGKFIRFAHTRRRLELS